MNDPTDSEKGSGGAPSLGPKASLNYYFLWSIERVGVLCNLDTIGGKDWYRWGVNLLLPAQRPDGSWLGRGNGGSPVIDTSMALLFLKRSDLLPDLRQSLQKRLKITDPWLEGKDGKGTSPQKGTTAPQKSPGEKSQKSGGDKRQAGSVGAVFPERAMRFQAQAKGASTNFALAPWS